MNVFTKLYDYQKEAVKQTLFYDKGIVCMPTGVGKCLKRGTKVLMFDGRIKNVEDIIIGDKIMGDDGKPRTILSLANGREMMYDVIPVKGDKYTVNESHILSLKITKIGKNRLTIGSEKYHSGDIVDISILDYLKTSKTAKHVLKGFKVAVDFESNNELPINSRLLGMWLADGTATIPEFTINNNDIEFISFIEEQAELLGVRCVVRDNSENSKTYRYSSKLKGKAVNNNFLNLLRDNNLFDNKHIPHQYKTASRQDRLELLAGILDGDGSLTNNCFELTLVNETLMDDVIFIARSLGFACYKKPVKKGIKSIGFIGNYFRINISGDIDKIPTLLPRKQATKRLQKKNVLVTGIKVKPVGIGEYFGFEIDGNRRFLLADFTVTHNTYCQASMIANDITQNPNQFRMYVVNAPRIMLSYQLLKEVYGFLIDLDIEARYMFVHSGGKTDEKELELVRKDSSIPFSEIGSSISTHQIRSMMNKAKKQNLPLIFFSTYNSADKIEVARQGLTQKISMVLNDEAHYLVQEQFHDILTTLPAPRCYFFTATMIHSPSDRGRGMNNEELYGKVLYSMSPLDAILLGKMVRPRLHIVTTEGVYNTDDYNRSLNKIIKDSFEQHEVVLNQTKQCPKLLISAKGTQGIRDFVNNSPEYVELRNAGVDIYAVSSTEEVGNQVNGERVRRQEFLKRLKKDGEDPVKKVIVLHYDILAEGIDVSGFTGIMPLRTLHKSKFLQTYGRSARPDKEDRISIDNGDIASDDLDKLNKPYSYIIIPNIIHSNEDDKANMVELITELRSFGFDPSEHILSSERKNGIPQMEELKGLNVIMRRIPKIGNLIDDLEADVEAEADAKLSKADLLKKNFNL